MTICQLQKRIPSIVLASAVAVFIGGCSQAPVAENKEPRKIVASWGKLPLRFSHRDDKDQFVTHPFFDVDPNIKNMAPVEANNFNINYFVATPKDSPHLYDLDLYSGKLYRERTFCSQDDIWDSYRADLMRPNFTMGFVPRVYNESKLPMRIVIVSDKKFIEPFKEEPVYFDGARVIGSVILDYCENFPCDLKEKWKSSQILFGVSSRDPDMRSLNSFTELKKKIDWSYAKGMLTNMHGYHKLGGKVFPAYRISKELNLKDTYAYFIKNAEVLTNEKMTALNEWRTGCMKMYDTVWDESEKIRAQKNGQADSFLKFFKEFYSKHSDKFYECQKLVRPASIIENHKRLWFFAYLQAFTHLEKNGFYYSCVDNAWAYNPKTEEGKFFVNQNKELERCRAKNFEKTFDQAINGMSLMKNQTNREYRFVEYDNGRGGSHQKIFGWISDKVQNYACKYEDKTPNQIPFDVFPHDVVWENFQQDEAGLVR